VAGRVVAFEATVDEITYICEDGERVVVELPHGVLLPPRPTMEQVAEAFAEWSAR
jgi:hypothetical protein